MGARTHVDPAAGLAFFHAGPVYACVLVPPSPGDSRRSALLAFAFDDRLDDAIDFARHAGGRNHTMVVERIAPGTEAWPTQEPVPAPEFIVERDGWVVLAPSIEGWVSMPPAQPHHLVQLVAALPAADEAAARAVLEALGCCAMLARVRAVLLGDSGAEIDAVVGDADGLRAGWFATPAVPIAADQTDSVPLAAIPMPPAPAPRDPDALLNEALAAYCTAFASPAKLDAWLQAHAPRADAAAVRTALDALLATTSDLLWSQTPAVNWNDAFAANLLECVRARHAWLAPPADARVLAYAQWLCWHEGLNGPPASA